MYVCSMYVRMYISTACAYIHRYHACRYSNRDEPLAVPQMKHSSGVGVMSLLFTPLVLGSGVCVPET